MLPRTARNAVSISYTSGPRWNLYPLRILLSNHSYRIPENLIPGVLNYPCSRSTNPLHICQSHRKSLVSNLPSLFLDWPTNNSEGQWNLLRYAQFVLTCITFLHHIYQYSYDYNVYLVWNEKIYIMQEYIHVFTFNLIKIRPFWSPFERWQYISPSVRLLTFHISPKLLS